VSAVGCAPSLGGVEESRRDEDRLNPERVIGGAVRHLLRRLAFVPRFDEKPFIWTACCGCGLVNHRLSRPLRTKDVVFPVYPVLPGLRGAGENTRDQNTGGGGVATRVAVPT
jgi:hypothetical protein